MTLWRSKDRVYGEDRVPIGSSGARPGTIMRAHAHMPRARKTLSPRRASAGKASPSIAERSTSYCAAIADETTNGQAPVRAIPPFFYTEGALDRSRMHIETKFLANQLCQFACPNRFSGRELRFEKGQYVALDLVWTTRSTLPRDQTCHPSFLEVCPRLIEGRSRDTIFVGDLRHRCLLYRDPAQHLVLDLHGVVGIEESAFLELGIKNAFWCLIQRTVFRENIGLRALAFVRWHGHSERLHFVVIKLRRTMKLVKLYDSA